MHTWAGGDSVWFPQGVFPGDLCMISDSIRSCYFLGFNCMLSGGTISKAIESQLQNVTLLRL